MFSTDFDDLRSQAVATEIGEEEQPLDYPYKEDTPLTPTEIREVERQKLELYDSLSKQKKYKEVTEIAATKAGVYAMSRALILVSGDLGVFFCCLMMFASTSYDNRDFFKSDDIQIENGLRIKSMNRLFRFLVSVISAIFFIYLTVGDYFYAVQISTDAYTALEKKIDRFNNPMLDDLKPAFAGIICGLVVVSVFGGLIFNNRRR